MAHVGTPGLFRQLTLGALNAIAGSSGKPTAMGNRDVRRVLVVELWNIGDVVLLLPFLTSLRSTFPAASITLLARPHARVVLAGTGVVDEFIDDADATENWLSLNPVMGGWRDLWRLRRRLRSSRFDVAFQCRLHVREHVILAMSGAKRRVGYAFGEGDRMLTDALEIGDPHRHKADDWLRLLSVFTERTNRAHAELCVSNAERDAATRFLEANGVGSDDFVIGIHPGASLPEKRWPIDRFAEVAEALVSRPGIKVIAFSDPAGYGNELSRIPGVVATSTTLRELIALIDRCGLLICNDSGPMHLAGGLGVGTVAVFGTGVARWFAPLGANHELVSHEDRADTVGRLESVSVASVLDAVERALGAIPARDTRLPSIQPLSPS